MPPHPRMSLAQQLLLTALVARFWPDAVHRPSDSLGDSVCTTATCCRSSSGQDLREITADMNAAPGYALTEEWFARRTSNSEFPAYGRIGFEGIEIQSSGRRSSRGTSSARKRCGRRHGPLRGPLVRRAAANHGGGESTPSFAIASPVTGKRVPLKPLPSAGRTSASAVFGSVPGARRRRCIRRFRSTHRSCSTSTTAGRAAP